MAGQLDHGPRSGSALDRWTASFLVRQRDQSGLAGAMFLVVGLALSWALTWVLGGASHVPPHWFYIPILIGGIRFGVAGAALAAAGSGILAGPLMPADVASRTAQSLSDWGTRMGAFVVIGVMMAAIVRRLLSSLGRELRVAELERALAVRKAAVIASVSHEFRTPLTIIEGVSKTLDYQELVTREGRPLLEGLSGATRRLEDLVDTLLVAAEGLEGRRPMQWTPVVLGTVVNDVAADLVELDAERRVRFECLSETDELVTDPRLIKRLLRYIIENALRFSPDDEPVDVRIRKDSVRVHISVRDRGPGIPEDLLASKLEPFVQADQSLRRKRGGLGIGLFAAQTIIEQLGGEIELKRHAEGGTEVLLSVPSSAPPVQPRESQEALA